MHSAEAILGMTMPGELFNCNETEMKEEYRELSKRWHPDLNKQDPLAAAVMSRVISLYEEGLKHLSEGKWMGQGFIQFRAIDGKWIRLKPMTSYSFELGDVYVCKNSVAYVIGKQHEAFIDNYVQTVAGIRYHDAAMQKAFEPVVPRLKGRFETLRQYMLIVNKPEGYLPLRDVLSYYGGVMPDRHMAWVLSTLYNIGCFLSYNGISHNGIHPDHYYISPSRHDGLLLGGWFYSVPYGERMLGAPADVFQIMSHRTKHLKQGTYETDMDSIRLVGRMLSGDGSGHCLQGKSTMPKPVLDWLLGGAAGHPVEEYEAWDRTLLQGYGRKSFVRMDISASDLYPQATTN
ncbi:J domain-containing protein [Paenibacillus sp. J5C_2022]|uniref:J domain-containing protein n=1 Tax=Paenibacillus sp. J5C2022 TaxID=2977129 RepID=UPI0021D2727D|nr:J domain-containing protein [Paenibacillus sp. J5C2022]MCU6709605.1 J domain-containing protein [Paenibacillus sp. J5C2022]